jgi:ABC-2 type transport system ATP-binding protein
MPIMEFVIQTKELTKKYPNGVTALDNVNLDIRKGEIFGLLGQNGAGKTTFLKILLGFNRPSRGSVNLFEEPLKTMSRMKIGYLPEKVTIHPFLTAYEFLVFAAKLYQIPYIEIRSICERILERVGLGDKGHLRVETFSKGMFQRLGLANALLNKPELLLLDEPGSGLDPIGLIDLRNILLNENKDNGTTVFINSHRLLEAEKLCTKVAVLKKGKLVASGSPEELAIKKNRVIISLETVNDSILNFFKSVGTIMNVEDKKITIEPNESTNIRELPKSIVDSGANILKYEIAIEDLEEVFMRLNG